MKLKGMRLQEKAIILEENRIWIREHDDRTGQDHKLVFSPADLLYILQEYQKHFKINVPLDINPNFGIAGSPIKETDKS